MIGALRAILGFAKVLRLLFYKQLNRDDEDLREHRVVRLRLKPGDLCGRLAPGWPWLTQSSRGCRRPLTR